MTELLCRLFVKDRENIGSPEVRRAYGTLASIVGIIVNILLASGKIIVGLLFGAIFMATDYVTSPPTAWGKVVFGFGAGLLTFLIRYFGVYPEGVSFAILFMNILTPYIEKLTARKVVGGTKA